MTTSHAASYDIFLSHSWADNEQTDRLCSALERANLRVWYDREAERDFESITRAIEAGLAASRAFLAFYSIDYPTRRACQYELTAAFVAASQEGDPRRRVLALNPEQGFTHILPVEVRDALIPSPVSWSDDTALDELVDKIVTHLEGVAGTFGNIIRFNAARWIGLHPLSAPRFVGRAAQMWQIHSALHVRDFTPATGKTGPSVTTLVGLAGVGKTLLAEEYALRFGAAFPGGVFWLRAGNGEAHPDAERADAERRRRDQLLDLARGLQLQVDVDMTTSELSAALGAEVDRRGDPCLWVVDDVPPGLTANEFRAWLPPSRLAKALLTTRSAEYAGLADRVEIGVLEEADAFWLLTFRREPTGADEVKAAAAIVTTLGSHALALDVAGAALESFAGLQSYGEFHQTLIADDDDALELASQLAPVLPTGHERSIAKTLLSSIRQLDAAALDYLRVASWISTAPISPSLVAAVLGAADDNHGDPDRAAVALALRDLDRHSLAQAVEEPEGARSVHPLVSRVVALADSDSDRREYLREATAHVLSETISQRRWRRDDTGAANALAHARRLIADPRDLLTAGLMGVVGRADLEQGDAEVALPIFERQLEAMLALGAGLEAELALATNIGGALHQLGRLTEARDLYEASLERARNALPDSSEAVTSLLHGKAAMLREAGDFAEARALQEEVYERLVAVVGAESQRAITELSNLAGTVEAQGHLEEALEIQERVLKVRRQDLGSDDPLTLNTLSNISILYRKLGRMAEARPLGEHVLEARRRALGRDHPDTMTALGNLAAQYAYEGDHRAALQLEREQLEFLRERRGETHPLTLIAGTNIADTLASLDRLEEALEIQDRIMTLARDTYGANSPIGLRTSANYATLLRASGDLKAALTLQESLLARYDSSFGKHHPETLVLRSNFAHTLFELKRFGEALALQEEVLAESLARYGHDHHSVVLAKNNLALTLNRVGERSRAIDLLEEVVDSQRRALPEHHASRAKALASLISLYALEGNVARAADLAVEERRLHLPEPIDEEVLHREAEAWVAQIAAKAQSELARSKPGRNDPCWCGSGKKFKKCHGA